MSFRHTTVELDADEWMALRQRGDRYRARALALAQKARKVRGWIRLWSQEKQRAELLLASRNEAWDKIEHLSKQNAELNARQQGISELVLAIANLEPFKQLAAARERAEAAESEVSACHKIMEQVRVLCGQEHAMTIDAVMAVVGRCEAAESDSRKLRELLARAQKELERPMEYRSGHSPRRARVPLDDEIDAALAAMPKEH